MTLVCLCAPGRAQAGPGLAGPGGGERHNRRGGPGGAPARRGAAPVRALPAGALFSGRARAGPAPAARVGAALPAALLRGRQHRRVSRQHRRVHAALPAALLSGGQHRRVSRARLGSTLPFVQRFRQRFFAADSIVE